MGKYVTVHEKGADSVNALVTGFVNQVTSGVVLVEVSTVHLSQPQALLDTYGLSCSKLTRKATFDLVHRALKQSEHVVIRASHHDNWTGTFTCIL